MINHDKTMSVKLPSSLFNLLQKKADSLRLDRSKLIRSLIAMAVEKDLPHCRNIPSKNHLRKIIPKIKIHGSE